MRTCTRGLGTRFEFRLQQHGPRLRAGLRDFHISVRNEPSGRMKLDVLQTGVAKQCSQLINSKQVAFMPIVHVPRQISSSENLAIDLDGEGEHARKKAMKSPEEIHHGEAHEAAGAGNSSELLDGVTRTIKAIRDGAAEGERYVK